MGEIRFNIHIAPHAKSHHQLCNQFPIKRRQYFAGKQTELLSECDKHGEGDLRKWAQGARAEGKHLPKQYHVRSLTIGPTSCEQLESKAHMKINFIFKKSVT